MLRLAATLKEMGHNVKLIVISPRVSHQVPDNLNITFVNEAEQKRGIKYFYYRRTAKSLQTLLDKINQTQPIDAILSNLPETDRITRYLTRYPIFHCIHNSLYQGQIKNQKSRFKRWQRKKRLQALYNNKHIIYVSAGARLDLEQHAGIKPASSHIIYNPFPIAEICRLSEEHPVKYRDYFIHIGRFNRQKRHDKLLRLYAESGVNNPLILMGEGSDEQIDEVKQWIKQYGLEERVIISGFSKNPFPYIRHASALLLSSDFEGFGNVLVEALICGTPVISFDCPSGPKEILTGELQEFLIPFDDTAAFIEKIRQLARNPRRIKPETAQINRFAAGAIANRYLDVISKIARD